MLQKDLFEMQKFCGMFKHPEGQGWCGLLSYCKAYLVIRSWSSPEMCRVSKVTELQTLWALAIDTASKASFGLTWRPFQSQVAPQVGPAETYPHSARPGIWFMSSVNPVKPQNNIPSNTIITWLDGRHNIISLNTQVQQIHKVLVQIYFLHHPADSLQLGWRKTFFHHWHQSWRALRSWQKNTIQLVGIVGPRNAPKITRGCCIFSLHQHVFCCFFSKCRLYCYVFQIQPVFAQICTLQFEPGNRCCAVFGVQGGLRLIITELLHCHVVGNIIRDTVPIKHHAVANMAKAKVNTRITWRSVILREKLISDHHSSIVISLPVPLNIRVGDTAMTVAMPLTLGSSYSWGFCESSSHVKSKPPSTTIRLTCLAFAFQMSRFLWLLSLSNLRSTLAFIYY